MFEKGEYVVYGSKGVCEITDISTINISGMNREKLYYFLRPVNDRDAKIFIPVDSDKIQMHRKRRKRLSTAFPGSDACGSQMKNRESTATGRPSTAATAGIGSES